MVARLRRAVGRHRRSAAERTATSTRRARWPPRTAPPAVQLRTIALSAIVPIDGFNPRTSIDDAELKALSAEHARARLHRPGARPGARRRHLPPRRRREALQGRRDGIADGAARQRPSRRRQRRRRRRARGRAARRRGRRQPAALAAHAGRGGARVPAPEDRVRPHPEGHRAAPADDAGTRPRPPADPAAPRGAVAARQRRRDPRRRDRGARRAREDRARPRRGRGHARSSTAATSTTPSRSRGATSPTTR